MQVSTQHHLRADEIASLEDIIEAQTGVDLDGDTYEYVEISDAPYDVILVDSKPDIVEFDAGSSLTVQGANRHDPTHSVVTVDAGAISFVSDGADIMRPGIVEVDTEIATDDIVLIAEETHEKILAVGRALVDGREMRGDQGKVIESIHHVGDELFEFSI